MIEPLWVGGMTVVTSGTVLRAIVGMVETFVVGEAMAIVVTVSLTEVLGGVEILSVE